MNTEQFKLVTQKMEDFIEKTYRKGDEESENKLYRIISLILNAKNLGNGTVLESVTALLLQQSTIAEKQLCLDKIISEGTLDLFRELDRVYTKSLYRSKQLVDQEGNFKRTLKKMQSECRSLRHWVYKLIDQIESKGNRRRAVKYLRKFGEIFRRIT